MENFHGTLKNCKNHESLAQFEPSDSFQIAKIRDSVKAAGLWTGSPGAQQSYTVHGKILANLAAIHQKFPH